jgi:hypothetical protein
MRALTAVLALSLVAVASAKIDPVGVWKPGVKHGNKLTAKEKEMVKTWKAMVEGGSLKINKDKTFGMAFAGDVMMGTWTLQGNLLIINVKEVVGLSAEAVKKKPLSERTGKFKIMKDGVQMLSLPEPAANAPKLMWRKSTGK